MAKISNRIKRRLNEYFKKRLLMYDYRKGWMKGTCPNCGKDEKYGVNLGTNRTNCFSCGYNEKPLNVVMGLENIQTYAEAVVFLNSNFEGVDFIVDNTIERMEFRKDSTLPEGYKLITLGKSQLARSARSYLKGRGFDIKELARAGFGYCTKGEYFGYIIMPFYMRGQLVYFNARNYLSNGPKHFNPQTEDFGIGKSVLIYNVDALMLYDLIYIVESVTNARTIGDNAISTGGKKLSDYQINLIIKSPVKRFIILLDPDAWEEAIELALKLVMFKKVKVVLLPEGEDVNKYGREKTMKKTYQNRYLNYNQLISIKNNL